MTNFDHQVRAPWLILSTVPSSKELEVSSSALDASTA